MNRVTVKMTHGSAPAQVATSSGTTFQVPGPRRPTRDFSAGSAQPLPFSRVGLARPWSCCAVDQVPHPFWASASSSETWGWEVGQSFAAKLYGHLPACLDLPFVYSRSKYLLNA